jgi:hypothetical protein
MFLSEERKRCLAQLIKEKKPFSCHLCNSGAFVIVDAFWPMMAPPHELNVNLNCANCGAGATVPLSLEDAQRCGFSGPEENLPKGP